MSRFILPFFLIANFCFPIAYGCGPGGRDEPFRRVENLVVFYDSSLHNLMQEIFLEFNNTHRNLQVRGKSYGSRELAYIILEGREKPDLVFVADPAVLENLITPRYVNWYLQFGRGALVLAFTENSRYSEIISPDNWYDILTSKDVRVGRVEENLSCLGYRTLMIWQLAEHYYRQDKLYQKLYMKSENNVYRSENKLIYLLMTSDLDFIFTYRRVAEEKKLKFISLPEQINLSSEQKNSFYEKVYVRLVGRNPAQFIQRKASVIRYAFTVPRNAWQKARKPYLREFFKYLFSPQAKQILKKHGIPLIPLSVRGQKNLPQELKGYVAENN